MQKPKFDNLLRLHLAVNVYGMKILVCFCNSLVLRNGKICQYMFALLTYPLFPPPECCPLCCRSCGGLLLSLAARRSANDGTQEIRT